MKSEILKLIGAIVLSTQDAERYMKAILPFIDCYSIVDTGSTDDTAAVIQRHLGHLPGVVTPQEWRDFSTARNLSLEIARKLGDYVFICDADDVVMATIDGGAFRASGRTRRSSSGSGQHRADHVGAARRRDGPAQRGSER